MNKFYLIGSLIFASSGFSETFYYLDKPRDVDVSSQEKTLLVFESAPIASNCQPSDIVDLGLLESLGNYETMLLDQETGHEKKEQVEKSANPIDLILKLSPLRQTGSAVCFIKLANGRTVPLNILLNAEIKRPVVEFKNILDRKLEQDSASTTTRPLELWNIFLQGGSSVALVDITSTLKGKEDALFYYSKLANYNLEYLGTDKQSFSAWKLRAYFNNDAKLPKNLAYQSIGDLHFSAWVRKDSLQNIENIKKYEEAFLYILSRHDLSANEIKRSLP